MPKRFAIVMLIVLIAISRFAFRSHYLYDLDSVNFALALERFDTSVHQPHPPGYFLYICLGRLVNVICQDANTAFVTISIAASCAAVAVIYLLTDEWFGRRAAMFAGLLFVFSPLTWFHGTVALTYIVEAFFSALAGYVCWAVYRGNVRLIVPAAIVVGLSAGFRPSSLVFVGPLFLFSIVKAHRVHVLWGVATLFATLAAWFIPMIWEIGGLGAYAASLAALWTIAPSRETIFNSNPLMTIARLFTICFIAVLCFGTGVALGFQKSETDDKERKRKVMFTWVWVTPALLFFTCIFLKFVNSGYLLLLAPPAFAWLGHWAAEWQRTVPLPSSGKVGLVTAACAINTAIYLWAPLYCSYSAVRTFEAELEAIQVALPQAASPQQAFIVGFDSHFLGYRHAGYYFPNYLTIQFPELRYDSGTIAFTMRQRDTQLASTLPVSAYRRFILFPLPFTDDEYGKYIDGIRSRFPRGHLEAVMSNGVQILSLPIEDLSLLFPSTVKKERLSGAPCVNCR